MVSNSEIKRSRKLGYAATLKTAPAYTWPKAREKRNDDPGPGPGDYDCSANWNDKGIGFGSSSRYQKDSDETPSPLDYQPTDAVRKSASAYKFRTKSVPEHLRSKTPGPGAYSPGDGLDATKPRAPAFSLLARGNVKQDADSTPAPNEYDATQYRARNVRGAKLKFRHAHSNIDPGPSPLDYQDPLARRPSSVGKTFGVGRPASRIEDLGPGPGEYRADVSAVRGRKQAWTMPRSVRDPGDVQQVPGPGTYFHGPVIDRDLGHGIRSDERSAPAFSVAGKPSTYAPAASPGPLDYGVPKDPRLRSAPAFTFHGTNLKEDPDRVPGPGAYAWGKSHAATRASAPQFSLGLKCEDPAMRDRRPGPAEYNLPTDSKPGVTLKFRHERTGKDTGPSPLDYADKDFRKIYMSGYTRKGFTFGMKPKPALRESTPGPIYAVGCTTLGIAAAERMTQQQLDQIAVL